MGELHWERPAAKDGPKEVPERATETEYLDGQKGQGKEENLTILLLVSNLRTEDLPVVY